MALIKDELQIATNVRHNIINSNLKKIDRSHLNTTEQTILDRIIHKTKTNIKSISTKEFNWLNDVSNSVKY